MASEKTPYVSFEPGGLIDAAEFNQLQVDVKNDIENQIESAKQEIKDGTVNESENAQKFAQSNEQGWLDKLDARYAAIDHSHEGQTVYRRYIKKFTASTSEVLLNHDLGRYPLVDTYELLSVADPEKIDKFPAAEKAKYEHCKILVYYGHTDADKFGLRVRVFRDEVMLGYSLEQLLYELGVKYTQHSTIADVINDMWAAFRKDPNDEIEHCVTDWINDCCNKKRTVGELKKAGEWEDFHVALKPRKCGKGADVIDNGEGIPPSVICEVDVEQANYNSLRIGVNEEYFTDANGASNENDPLCLMFLLRI